MLVFFWTDILIYVLVVVAAVFAMYARRHEHLRGPWHEVARSGVAMGALVVLAFYVVIGLLDSIHFRENIEGEGVSGPRYTGKVVSVLDHLVGPLRLQRERTYSAPFATHAYSKESVELGDGRTVREYPKLIYGGAHLSTPDQRGVDILQRTVLGGAKGVLIWVVVFTAIVVLHARRRGTTVARATKALLDRQSKVRWRSALFTLLVMSVLGFVLAELAIKYHVFGTDKVGEDVFYQSVKSIRTGLVIGTLTTLIMLPFAILRLIGLGAVRRRYPVCLYHLEFHSRRIVDRRRDLDAAGVSRQSRGGFRQS